MTQKGTHTWDLVLKYHRCPKCGFIIESREDYTHRLGAWIKDLTCSRCGEHFSLEKNTKPTFGPLIGTPQPPEIDWSTLSGQ